MRDKRVLRGIVAGAVGGLAASWVINVPSSCGSTTSRRPLLVRCFPPFPDHPRRSQLSGEGAAVVRYERHAENFLGMLQLILLRHL